MSAVACGNVGSGTCGTISPTVGALGTPVISISADSTAGTLYVVAEMQSVSSGVFAFYHFLHALDITTLNEGTGNENFGAPIQICSNSNLCGSYTTASKFSEAHIQTPWIALCAVEPKWIGARYGIRRLLDDGRNQPTRLSKLA